MRIRGNLWSSILVLITALGPVGCYDAGDSETIGDEERVSEAASAISCLSLSWPFQGCLGVTPTADKRFLVSGIDLGDGSEYFNDFEVCYKKRGSWQNCEGSGLSNVQGTSPVISDNPADGDFDWSTPVLYTNEEYRVKVYAVIYSSTHLLHDGYHRTQAATGGGGGGGDCAIDGTSLVLPNCPLPQE